MSFFCGTQKVKFWIMFWLLFSMQLKWMETGTFKLHKSVQNEHYGNILYLKTKQTCIFFYFIFRIRVCRIPQIIFSGFLFSTHTSAIQNLSCATLSVRSYRFSAAYLLFHEMDQHFICYLKAVSLFSHWLNDPFAAFNSPLKAHWRWRLLENNNLIFTLLVTESCWMASEDFYNTWCDLHLHAFWSLNASVPNNQESSEFFHFCFTEERKVLERHEGE